MNRTGTFLWLLTAMLAVAGGPVRAQIKIVYIDPLSGLMAATGDHGLRELRFAADRVNERGGILGQKLEIVAMDNKLSPQESLALLTRAVEAQVREGARTPDLVPMLGGPASTTEQVGNELLARVQGAAQALS